MAAAKAIPASARASTPNSTPRDFTTAGYRGMLEASIKERPVPHCPSCAEPVDRRHRFCPWCAAPVRRKLMEFFAPHPGIPGEAVALRVSPYLGGEGSGRPTRLSILGGGRGGCAGPVGGG